MLVEFILELNITSVYNVVNYEVNCQSGMVKVNWVRLSALDQVLSLGLFSALGSFTNRLSVIVTHSPLRCLDDSSRKRQKNKFKKI